MPIPTLAVTGTKGKTTTVAVIAQALQNLGKNVLKVDTTGHYVNGEQRSTLEDSKAIWKLVPTVAPGRYLWEFQIHPELQQDGVAVLEAALGSSRSAGLAYRAHDVGIFLNVFEDHLGSSSRLQTKSDIAVAKEFIFSQLAREGIAVFNADDELVVRSLRVVPEDLETSLLPFGLTFEHFDIASHLEGGGEAVTIDGTKVILQSKDENRELVDVAHIPWTFNGQYMPSVWNILAAVSGLYALHGRTWSGDMQTAVETVRLDKYGGRLTLLRAASGATVLADYAHEKVSLREIGKLAHGITESGGKVIGVVRLAHDRTDELIHETGRVIGESFDTVVVYDKIDGVLRKPRVTRSKYFPQVAGRTSELLAAGVQETNEHVERIVREDEAIARAAELAKPEDVVVVIVNDDIRQSLRFIQDSFKAEFM